MLTYWETLIAKKSNITVSDSYAKLWGKKSQGGYTVETYTGTLPATLTGTKAGYLEHYTIYGNTVQDGTPTPENPIVPSGCGGLETAGVHAGQYKLPLTVNGVEYPIYLGESQTTRKVKKLVLTGGNDENWFVVPVSINDLIFRLDLSDYPLSGIAPISTHYTGSTSDLWRDVGNNEVTVSIRGLHSVSIHHSGLSGVTDWKAFLAAQYAAGTPVTVWYVLAEPETAVVNESLMKISDYADTIDNTQSTVQIPTAAGETTISWAGEGLAPSEIELVYKIKG